MVRSRRSVTVGLSALLCVGSVAAAEVPKAGPAKDAKPAHRVRVIRSWPEELRVRGRGVPARVELLFDYTAGVAIERLVTEGPDGSRTLVRSQTFPPGVNVPGPSGEEIEEAMQIVRADLEMARLISNANAKLDGGFEIFEPAGSPCGPGTRCLKIQIDTPDGLGFIRNVVVDLTKQAIAYRAWAPEWNGGKQ